MTLLSRDRTLLYQQPTAVISTGVMSNLVRAEVLQSQGRTCVVQLVDRSHVHGPLQDTCQIDAPQRFRIA
jgi:hypothetical protein